MNKEFIKRIWSWVRLTMGVVGLIVLVSVVDINEVKEAFENVKWIYLAPAWLLLMASTATKTYRWWLPLQRNHVNLSFGRLFGTYLIGAFYSQFLPGSSAGGDAMRMAETSVDTGRTIKSMSAVVIERGVGLVSIVTTASLILLTTAHEGIPETLIYFVHLLSFAGITTLVSLRYGWFVTPITRIMEKLKMEMPARKILDLSEAMKHDLAENEVIWMMVGLSLLANFFSMTSYYLALVAVTEPVSYFNFISLVALIVTIEIVPLTPGSLGVRESAYVFFLAFLGVDQHTALSIGLLIRLLTWTQGLLGGMILLDRGLRQSQRILSSPEV